MGMVNVYRLLLYAPIEYLSRSVRNDSFRRAIALDVSLSRVGNDKNNNMALTTIRTFLLRVVAFLGTSEHLVHNFVGLVF